MEKSGPMNVSRVIDAYEAHLDTVDKRNDDDKIHVSDVANGCARQVWWRVHHGATKTFTNKTKRKMRMGHLWEAHVRNAFIHAGYNDVKTEVVDVDGVTGHPDIVVTAKKNGRKHLIEVKTTTFWRAGSNIVLPTYESVWAKNRNYVFQAYAYARAEGCSSFTVHIIDRNTGEAVDLEYIVDDIKHAYLDRATTFIDLVLDPDQEPPPDVPEWTRNGSRGVSYLCKGCPIDSCPNQLPEEAGEYHNHTPASEHYQNSLKLQELTA